MRQGSVRVRLLIAAIVAVLLVAGCGGGGDDDGQVPLGGVEDGADDDAGSAAPEDTGSGVGGGVEQNEQVSLTTDPGTAFAEVDGDRLTYASAGSINHTCEVGPDAIRVGFQTPEGQDLTLQAGLESGRWRGQLTFAGSGGERVQYTVVLAQMSGTLGVEDEALSYEGTADRIEGSDVLNAEEVDARVAVNCATAGDGSDPTAVIDDETYTFPVSGAQSFSCTIAPDELEIRVNRLALDDLQLTIDVRGGPDDWIGSVFIVTPDGNFTAALSGEAEGLTIDGDTVTYEGMIEGEGGDEVAASVSVTCP